jgi:hypothetical protein
MIIARRFGSLDRAILVSFNICLWEIVGSVHKSDAINSILFFI